MCQVDPSPTSTTDAVGESDDARLVQQLRNSKSDAGYRFFRAYYLGVYRYLLRLSGRLRWTPCDRPALPGPQP
jgi:hypothetical protein